MSWRCRVPTGYDPVASRAAADTVRAQGNVGAEANKPRPRKVHVHNEAQDGQHAVFVIYRYCGNTP